MLIKSDVERVRYGDDDEVLFVVMDVICYACGV